VRSSLPAARRRGATAVESFYEKLETLNFSRDFLEIVSQTTPTAIGVLPVLGVYWSDRGSPEPLMQILERAEQPGVKQGSRAPAERQNRAGQPNCSVWQPELS